MKEEYLCESCGHYFVEDDFDDEEGMCLGCIELELETDEDTNNDTGED